MGETVSWNHWEAGMEQAAREAQVKVGGMIQIEPLNLPLPLTLREWLWESYPDNLSEKLRDASQAHKELVDAAVLHMEGHSQEQMENSQPYEDTASSGDHRTVASRVMESFVEISSRKERREQYNAKRDRSRAWQATRTA